MGPCARVAVMDLARRGAVSIESVAGRQASSSRRTCASRAGLRCRRRPARARPPRPAVQRQERAQNERHVLGAGQDVRVVAAVEAAAGGRRVRPPGRQAARCRSRAHARPRHRGRPGHSPVVDRRVHGVSVALFDQVGEPVLSLPIALLDRGPCRHDHGRVVVAVVGGRPPTRRALAGVQADTRRRDGGLGGERAGRRAPGTLAALRRGVRHGARVDEAPTEAGSHDGPVLAGRPSAVKVHTARPASVPRSRYCRRARARARTRAGTPAAPRARPAAARAERAEPSPPPGRATCRRGGCRVPSPCREPSLPPAAVRRGRP